MYFDKSSPVMAYPILPPPLSYYDFSPHHHQEGRTDKEERERGWGGGGYITLLQNPVAHIKAK